MPYSTAKEKRAKELNFELGHLSISALVKIQMRKHHERIINSIKEAQKKAAKQDYQHILSHVTDFFSKEENHSKRHLVVRVPYIANSKAITDVLRNVSLGKGKEGALKSKSLYLLAGDEEDGRVMHACYIAEVRAYPLIHMENISKVFDMILTCTYRIIASKVPRLLIGPRKCPTSLEAKLVGSTRLQSGKGRRPRTSIKLSRRLQSIWSSLICRRA
jgi:alanyl-tRNA synthetase